jgi:thioredoxin 1
MNNKIIKFGAEWCGPCKAMKPHMEQFKQMIAESNIEVLDLDVDEAQNAEISNEYGVRSIPHTVFIKDGKPVKTLTGLKTSDDLYTIYKQIYESNH